MLVLLIKAINVVLNATLEWCNYCQQRTSSCCQFKSVLKGWGQNSVKQSDLCFRPLFLGDPNVELLDRDQVLHIKSARRVDKGRYQCSATNTAGKQVKEVRLVVHGKFMGCLIPEDPLVLLLQFLFDWSYSDKCKLSF